MNNTVSKLETEALVAHSELIYDIMSCDLSSIGSCAKPTEFSHVIICDWSELTANKI